MKKARSEYLPPEILIEIVLRLPIKSIITWTSVSKSWNSLIKNPNFISTHLNHTIHSYNHNAANLLLLREVGKSVWDPKEVYSLHWDNEAFDECTRLVFPFHHLCAARVFRIVGTCNGLVCLANGHNFFVWNPCIRKYVTLPTSFSDERGRSRAGIGVGFGFDSKTNDYKVVRIVTFLDEFGRLGELEVKVYSLATGKWKMISAATRCLLYEQCDPVQAFVNGALHWAAYQKMNDEIHDFILAFDLSDDNVREIMLPNDLLSDNYIRSCFLDVSVFGESLAVYKRITLKDRCIHLWVMKEYGVWESWNKMFAVSPQGPEVKEFRIFGYLRKTPKAVGFRKSGELVIEMERRKLVSLDPELKKLKDLCRRAHGYEHTFVDPYVESLVLLDNSKGAVSY